MALISLKSTKYTTLRHGPTKLNTLTLSLSSMAGHNLVVVGKIFLTTIHNLHFHFSYKKILERKFRCSWENLMCSSCSWVFFIILKVKTQPFHSLKNRPWYLYCVLIYFIISFSFQWSKSSYSTCLCTRFLA